MLDIDTERMLNPLRMLSTRYHMPVPIAVTCERDTSLYIMHCSKSAVGAINRSFVCHNATEIHRSGWSTWLAVEESMRSLTDAMNGGVAAAKLPAGSQDAQDQAWQRAIEFFGKHLR